MNIIHHKAINFKNKNIKFVRTFQLLGVIIDNRLNFEDQVISICKKVNSLTCLLTKGSYLFTNKIKPTLFKLFIMNRFEYYGSAWFPSINQQCLDRLEKCFAIYLAFFENEHFFIYWQRLIYFFI